MLNLFSITVVLARFFALHMLVNATLSLPAALALIKETIEVGVRFVPNSIVLIITGLAYVTVALLLFIYAKEFAGYVTRGLDNPSIQISEGHLGVLQTVALTILGAYILTYAIPNLVKIVTLYLLPNPVTENDVFYPAAQRRVPVEYLVEAVAQLALGIWLIVGSKGITRVLRRGWNSIKAE